MPPACCCCWQPYGFLHGCLHMLPALHMPHITAAQCCTLSEALSSILAPVMAALLYSHGPRKVTSAAEC